MLDRSFSLTPPEFFFARQRTMTRSGERAALSILHIGKFYPPHRGGMESHLRDLVSRQAQINCVRVVVSNSLPRTEISEMDAVNVTRVARYATVASMPVCPGLVTAIRNAPADLVHLHMPNPGAALALLSSGHSGTLIITHHADTLGRRILRRFSDPFVAQVMRRANRIIVSSSRYLDSSGELAPFRDKCRVIPFGIDMPDRPPAGSAPVQALRARFGDRPILAVGRLVPYKGFDVLIRAMKFVETKLLLVGSGPLAAQLASLAVAEGVTGKISILGPVHDLGPYFTAACLFVLPSINRAEAFGLAQVEAMAAGLPVINTDIDSGVPQVSRDGQTGLTVPPGDEIALARAIQTLLDREDLRLQFGSAARARAETEFSADLMAQRTMDLYKEALGHAQPV